MGDLYIRAIETKDKIDKVLGDGFAPGIISSERNDNAVFVKFEMKKIKRLYRRYTDGGFVSVKCGERLEDCVIKDIVVDEITGAVKFVELNRMVRDDRVRKKVPIVFNCRFNYDKGQFLRVYIPELEVVGRKKNIPDFISVDIEGTNGDKIMIGNLELERGFEVLNKEDDIIAVIRNKNEIYNEVYRAS